MVDIYSNGLTPSFSRLQDAVEECSKIVVVDCNYKDTSVDSTCCSKKAKNTSENDTTPSKAAAAPTSFSLFDMMDAQKGAFALPPRVMAYQVLEAYEREQKSGKSNEELGKSTLELLEKADDMEDLSPDPESWEEIRTILYNGLINISNIDESSRYLKVHISLHEKCRNNNALISQLWGLAQNMIGSLLHFSNQFEEEKTGISSDSSKQSMDQCWDTIQAILNVLSKMAVDYVMSAVGNELEIERMVLGICLILSNDYLACIMGMIEPMSGFLEVWSRFVDPSKFMAIIQVSGLGGIVLRRCESLGKNDSSKSICKMIQSTEIESDSTLLADMEHSNFLQSLLILRTILFRCGGSREIVSLVHDQFTSDIIASCASFVLDKGVASTNDVQAILKKIVTESNEGKHLEASTTFDDMKAVVLKPFHTELKMKKDNDNDLELLCTQTIQLLG